MSIDIVRLPSGFWAVFVNGVWINASQPNERAARKFAEGLKRYAEGAKK